MKRRIIAAILAIAMYMSLLPAVYAAAYSDTAGNWAEDEIERWSDYDVIEGQNGMFRLNDNITRGEMAVIIDRMLEYQTTARNTFSDLPDNAFYTQAVRKLNAAGVMQGSGGNVRPLDPITREEAFVMLCRAFELDGTAGQTSFADNAQISAWARGSIAALADMGFIAGRPGNLIAPLANIERAEVIKLLDNLVLSYITSAGTHSPNGSGIVIVRAENVVLRDAAISGNLIVAGNISEVTLENCTVSGRTLYISEMDGDDNDTQAPPPDTTETNPSGILGGGSSSGSGSGTQTAFPEAYPLPKAMRSQMAIDNMGVFDYDMTYFVTLTAQNDAEIYYTLSEGADSAPIPTTASNKFETYQYRQIEITQPDHNPDGPVTKTYNLKAIAVRNGRSSEVISLNYEVTTNPRETLKVSPAVDAAGRALPGVTLIQDYDSDKMYLIEGTDKAVLLDAGLYDTSSPADLYSTAKEIAGEKELVLVIGHAHSDHWAMTSQFVYNDAPIWMHARAYERTLNATASIATAQDEALYPFETEEIYKEKFDSLTTLLADGDEIDLGGLVLEVIEMPGHEIGGIMLFDRAGGNLYSTDQVGNNRTHITDSFWMQFDPQLSAVLAPADAMDIYLSTLQILKEKLGNDCRNIMTGHNDITVDADEYLAHLETAVQRAVDEGEGALTPSLRTLEMFDYLEETFTLVSGDRLTDRNWAGINVHRKAFLSGEYLNGGHTAIAELSNLTVTTGANTSNLLWEDENFGINLNWYYPDNQKPVRKENLIFTATLPRGTEQAIITPTAMSTAAESITINGEAVQSRQGHTVLLENEMNTFEIIVTAADGESTKTYTVVIQCTGEAAEVAAPYTYPDYETYADPFFPDSPGTFTVTQYIALFSDTEGAQIRYTVDGSDPKTSETAMLFDQTQFKAESGAGGAEVGALIEIGDDTSGLESSEGKVTNITLKAYAFTEEGESEVAEFAYTIDRMAQDNFKNRRLYTAGADGKAANVWQIIDYDSDKMYLIEGENSALLIDAGMAPATADNLLAYAGELAGGKPVDLFISHGHPDHVTSASDFLDAGRSVYMHRADYSMAIGFINEFESKGYQEEQFTFIEEGEQFDLGGVILDTYFVPGHTAGHLVLLDKASNVLYSSDAVGCNRRGVADSLTMSNRDVRELLSSVLIFRDKLEELDAQGIIDLSAVETWTGHDDYAIYDLPGHLETVLEAAQNIIDYGPDAAMRVSVRDTASSDGASFAGDRYANGGTGHFIVMNGRKDLILGEGNRELHEQIANLANIRVLAAGNDSNCMIGLSTIALDGQALTAEIPQEAETILIYPVAAASGAVVTVNGIAPDAQGKVELSAEHTQITIMVTAPDGESTQEYTLTITTE